jgi:hypothetical protein
MKNGRHVEEIVSRITAILAFYRQEDGRWDVRPPLTGELRTAIEELKSLDSKGTHVRLQFYRTLEAELVARYDEPVGRRLVSLIRGVAQPVFREPPTVAS